MKSVVFPCRWCFCFLVALTSVASAGASSDSAVEAPASAYWAEAVADAGDAESATQRGAEESNGAADDPMPVEGTDPAATPVARPFSEMVENIVITTRKRRELIREIPVSVTALNADSIEQLGIRRIEDATTRVPNLEYGETVGFTNAARSNIRGVGQTDPIGTLDPGVGLFVDGVFFARAQASLLRVADVDRIEIIRGPQGTIFGKNTIGGAVNVITRKPDFELGATAEARIGNFDLFETRASVNVPLIEERMAARVSFATATRDGFEKDRLGGSDPNDDKLLAGRAQLRIVPTDDLEILLSGDYSRENKVLSQGKCKVVNQGGTPQLAAAVGAVGFTQACADVEASSNPRRVESDLSFLRDDLVTFGGAAQITWSLGTDTELRSISSVRGLDNENFNDFDGTRIELIRPAIDAGGFEQTQLSQELQLTSKALDGKLSYLVGLYAFKEQSKDNVFEGFLGNVTADDIVAPFPGLDAATTANLIRGAQIDMINRVDNLSYAAFGQLSYDVTSRLNVTAGLRFTQDRRRLFRRGIALTPGLDPNNQPALPGDVTTLIERSSRFSDFTPSASISYRFSDDFLGYANFSTGFKSGGFNGRAFLRPGDTTFPLEVDPEDLTTYEIGFKATFADRRIALNAAAFYSIYEDIQLVAAGGDPAVNNVQIQLVNAGESIINGGEVELVVFPLPDLQIRTAIGVLHDRFTEFDDVLDPTAKDRHLQFLSAYQTSTSVEYGFGLGNLGRVIARADWSTRSRQFLDVPNSDSLESGKRGLLDARLSLDLADGATVIALFGRNLLDREYLVSGVDFSASFGNAQRFVGPPRTYGLEVRRRF